MKSAVYLGKENIRVEDLDIPQISGGELLLRVKAVGVCPTDVKAFYSGSSSIATPRILGHEVSGIIEKSKSDEFAVGARVNVAADSPCMVCDRCLRGLHNMCRNLTSLGVNVDGGYSEFMRIPADYIKNGMVIKLSDNVSFIEGTFVEPVAVSINALSLARPEKIRKAIIIGDGPNAMIHLQLLKKYYKVPEVYVTGIIESRLQMARNFGASKAIDVVHDHDSLENIKGNMDFIDITIGNRKALDQALTFIDAGTYLVVFGGSLEDSIITTSMNQLHYNQVTYTGSTGTTLEHYNEAAGIVNNKILDLENIISKAFPIETIKDAFLYSRELKGMKGAITFD